MLLFDIKPSRPWCAGWNLNNRAMVDKKIAWKFTIITKSAVFISLSFGRTDSTNTFIEDISEIYGVIAPLFGNANST